MEDIMRDKNLIDSMMDYGKICERQQDQISKLTEQIDKLNGVIDSLQEEKLKLQNRYDTLLSKHSALRDELDTQIKRSDEILNCYITVREKYKQLELEKNNRVASKSPKIDRETFLQAYEVTHDLYELGKILGVSRQSIYNYRRMYL